MFFLELLTRSSGTRFDVECHHTFVVLAGLGRQHILAYCTTELDWQLEYEFVVFLEGFQA